MQNDQGKLRIHTALKPEESPKAAEPADRDTAVSTAQKEVGVNEKRARRKYTYSSRRKERAGKDKLTQGERLVRNAAVACALFLSVMALKNMDQPWSQKATEGIRAAMNMRIDWDETLGQLSFVRALVPDTALVFFNLGQSDALKTPVQGQVEHEYTEQQPWLEYRCQGEQTVCAAIDGTITAVGQGAGSDWSILLTDAEGREAVYGYVDVVYVEAGQKVEAGQQLGTTKSEENSRLYFEWKEDGVSQNPSAMMR